MILFQDECVFQQEGTLCRTWAPIGEGVEVNSESVRKSAKVYGAIRLDPDEPRFHFRFERKDPETGKVTFNTANFIRYLEQLLRYYRPRGQKVHLIVDGAAYHRAAGRWAQQQSDWIELHFLPGYSPDFNPVEQVWRKTKRKATHNRHFIDIPALRAAIFRCFLRYHGNPKSLLGIVSAWL